MLGSSEYLYDYDWDPKSGTFEVQLKVNRLGLHFIHCSIADSILEQEGVDDGNGRPNNFFFCAQTRASNQQVSRYGIQC
jgi:hypothetical protein